MKHLFENFKAILKAKTPILLKFAMKSVYVGVLSFMVSNILSGIAFKAGLIIPQLVLFTASIVFLVYFCIDFIFLCLGYVENIIPFVLDMAALRLIYLASKSINDAIGDATLTATPIGYLLLIHLLYLFWNIKQKETTSLKLLNVGIVLIMGVNYFLVSEILFLFSLIAMCVGLGIITVHKIERKVKEKGVEKVMGDVIDEMPK